MDLNKNANEYTLEEIQEMVTTLKRLQGDIPEYYTFESILNRMLSKVPAEMDKRVGSIIYDALAPCAAEMANEYIEIQIYKDQTFVTTAIGDNLDAVGENFSIPRLKATYSERIGEFRDTNDNLVNLPVGSRFSVPDFRETVNYVIIRQIEIGKAILRCEQEGTIGNEYFGAILPLFNIDNLKEATLIGIQTPAQDREDDEVYRKRIIDKLSAKGFAGNIRAYKDLVIEEIDGAAEPKVYPVWDGGGTVKLSIVDTQFNAISPEFQQQIKDIIDPEQYEGNGVGLAPIGHKVTIDTPIEYKIDITATLDLDIVTIGQVIEPVKEEIEDYLYGIRRTWVDSEYTSVYRSQIISAILKVPGIKNATNVLINDQGNDINLLNTAEVQYIPVLGEVTLLENK